MKRKTTETDWLDWDDSRWMMLAGLLAALILLVVVINDSADSAVYQRGRAALEALDCQTAVAEYDSVLNATRLIDMRGFAYRAGREKEQCQLFQQALAQEAAGQPGEAAVSLYSLMRRYENSPLYPLASERITALMDSYRIETLASAPFCQEFTGANTGAGMSDSRMQKLYPRVVDACGKMYEASGLTSTAITWYNTFLESNIGSEWSSHFRDALARSMLTEVALRGAQGMMSPVWVGDGTGSTFALDFYIQTPQAGRVIMAGPTTSVLKVEASSGTTPGSGSVPNTGGAAQSSGGDGGTCPKEGRPVHVELPVGTYQVIIETGEGDTAHLYHSAWKMPTGQYEMCLVLE